MSENANEFDKTGDYQLSEYIIALLPSTNTFVPQIMEDIKELREVVK